MDPLALAAVVGLVFAGKRLADSSEDRPAKSATTRPPVITRRDIDLMANSRDHAKDAFDVAIMTPDLGRRVGDWRLQPKNEIPSLQDVSPVANRYPFGQPVYDFSNRQYVTNKMNNLQPIERVHVGPGLGVDADVPATGGFHQFFRALPNNINEERLTTLEGRPGPSNPVVKNGTPLIGDITHQAKETKAWHRDPAAGRAGGQGGAITGAEGRPDFLKTRRATIRQETGPRTDGQEYGPAQYNVAQPYATSSKCYTDKSLTRLSENRSNPDRAGNGQRMNVRADPLGQGGAMTNLRVESVPVPVSHMNGSRFQNYVAPEFDKFNEKKSQLNPLANPVNLDIAIQQLEKNPVAMVPLAVQ